jgi:hypothetical protein
MDSLRVKGKLVGPAFDRNVFRLRQNGQRPTTEAFSELTAENEPRAALHRRQTRRCRAFPSSIERWTLNVGRWTFVPSFLFRS